MKRKNAGEALLVVVVSVLAIMAVIDHFHDREVDRRMKVMMEQRQEFLDDLTRLVKRIESSRLVQ